MIQPSTYIGDLKSDHTKSGLFEGQISNGPYVVEFKWSQLFENGKNGGFSLDLIK